MKRHLGRLPAVSMTFLCILFVFLIVISSAPGKLYAVGFPGTELLARPTDSSVTINVVADAALQVYFVYDTESHEDGSPEDYSNSTSIIPSTANEPIVAVIDGLEANTRYYYRMIYSENGGANWIEREEHSFHTQRPPAATFTFTITSDSHVNILLGNSSTWQTTLSNVANDHPDFNLDLGDTFAMDGNFTLPRNSQGIVTSAEGADEVYLFQRSSIYFGRISHSAPIFLAMGNHEEEEGWHLDDNGDPESTTSLPVWGTNARKRYFPNPVPDLNGFYSGNTDTYWALDGDQLHEDYYAWTWGDALFIVLDPFWYTTAKPFTGNTGGGESSDTGDGDRWHWTLGSTQYDWLKQTLEDSNATFKFIFMHHMTGGTQDYIRGGAYAAQYCEWGGYDEIGNTYSFATRRPGWYAPVHQVLVENGVSAVFHGHDHQYAYEMLNDIVYQSMPSAGFSTGFGIYTEGGYTIRVLPSPGHLRVTVSPSQATVDYVQTSGGAVAYSYTIGCLADFDSNDDVNEADLAVFAADFGRTDCSGGCYGDLDPVNGVADGSDLAAMIAAFGPCD